MTKTKIQIQNLKLLFFLAFQHRQENSWPSEPEYKNSADFGSRGAAALTAETAIIAAVMAALAVVAASFASGNSEGS